MAKLLYIEDDPDVRTFVASLLSGDGYDVVAAGSAEEGAALLARDTYDVLLTDYNLPGHNADWLLTVGRDKGLLRQTPAVVLSGTPEPPGIDGYQLLRKPVDVEVLLATLESAIDSRRGPSADRRPEEDPALAPSLALTLYITGTSRESRKAVRNLQRALAGCDASRYRLNVHDVTAASMPPDALELDRIVVTPTLVRAYPLPKVWAFGDLSNVEVLDDIIAPAR